MSKRYYRRQKPKGFGPLFLFALLMIGLLLYSQSKGSLKVGSGAVQINGDDLIGGVLAAVKYPLLGVLAAALLYYGLKLLKTYRRRKKIRMSRIHEIDRMTGKEFEVYLKVYFEDLGYKVEEKGGSGDKGGDLILTSRDGKRIVVQAKRYDKHVPFEAVQQAHTAKSLYKCHEAWVVTNNKGYTRQARETAAELNVQLWDREKLIEKMAAYNDQKGEGSALRQMDEAQVRERPVYSLPNSTVFHTTDCKNGRHVSQKPEAIRYETAEEAVRAGKRKCNCYE